MRIDTTGKCDIPKLEVYADGIIVRCSYNFGHGGDHSWENVRMGWPGHENSNGKLSPRESEFLEKEEDD
jgi:hypothetical protein